MKRVFLILAIILGAGVLPADAQRKNPWGVAIKVNDGVVTNWEIDQRVLLLSAFGTTGDLNKIAEEQLIEDRLRLQAGRAAGVSVTDEEIEAGVDEFAQRGEITGEQLYTFIAQRGADRESMRDFVRAGLVWRNLVQARFGPRSAVSESEIDTAISLLSGQDAQEILISEIRLPLDQRGDAATMDLAKRLSKEIKSEGAFGAAARRYSQAPSRARSGRLDWIPVATLPPALAGQILALNPGEVSTPVTLGPTVGLFQLRGTRPARNQNQEVVSVAYTTVNVPGSAGSERARSEAISLINDVDTCDDLRAQAERFGVDPAFTDNVDEVPNLPGSIALELANLDPGESSYYTNAGGGITVVTLCSRLRDLPEGARENIRNGLFQQRISGFGQGYLQELKGDAVITYTE